MGLYRTINFLPAFFFPLLAFVLLRARGPILGRPLAEFHHRKDPSLVLFEGLSLVALFRLYSA
jgi:hypothetical protein